MVLESETLEELKKINLKLAILIGEDNLSAETKNKYTSLLNKK